MQQCTRIGTKLAYSLSIARSTSNSCNKEQLSLLSTSAPNFVQTLTWRNPSSPLLAVLRVLIENLSSALQVKRMTRYTCGQNHSFSRLCIITRPFPECSDAGKQSRYIQEMFGNRFS